MAMKPDIPGLMGMEEPIITYTHLWWVSREKKTVQKGIVCPMGHPTNTQRYDSKDKVWIWYCEKCQAPIDRVSR